MKALAGDRANFAAALIVVLLFGAVAAYFQSFSGMASYDDEGALISSVRDVISGKPLYTQVQTPYGPLYYAYEWLAHSPFGMAVSNNSVRLVSSVFRAMAVLLLFLLCHKMTRSTLISWGASIVAFGELEVLSREPAHPQELCIVLLLALALAGCYTSNRTRLMLIMSALAAGMALTKINVGIFAVAAIGVVLVFFAEANRLWTAGRALVACAALALPAALMSGMLGQSWALRYCILVTISTGAALIAIWQLPKDVRVGVREFLIAVFGLAAALILISWFAIARGATVSAMLDWLVLLPRKAFGPVWFLAAKIASPAIPWAVVCAALAWRAATGRLNKTVVMVLKLLLAALVFGFCLYNRPAQS